MATHAAPAGGGSGPSAVTAPMLVGREPELAELRRALARPPAVVLVEGEAGVGKSRLVRELMTTGDRTIAVGACLPFRGGLTLGPIVDAVRSARPSVAGLPLTNVAGALRPLFPEWSADLPPAPEPLPDPGAARHLTYRALAELIGLIGSSVLVVEDAHWADPATLEFLLFLAASQRSLAVVVTYRPEEVAAASPLRRLSARPPATGSTRIRITLAPLDPAGTARLISSLLGGEPVAPELAVLLHQHTDGLPLAVEESVRLLADRADLVRRDGVWARRTAEPLQVPPTVRDAVLERLARLRPSARRVLAAAAVLAAPTAEPMLRQVAGLPAEHARVGLREALRAGLLSEDDRGRVSFRHALMGRAVYQAIPGPERRRRHQSAGAALQRAAPPPLGRLARHFREAGDAVRWLRYAEQAADQASGSGDFTTAVTVLTEVLTAAEPPPAAGRGRLARKLATAAVHRWEGVDELHGQAVGTVRAVLATPGLSARAQAELRSRLGRLLLQREQWEAGRHELELAAAQLAHDPVEAARVMIYLGMAVGPTPAAEHLRWLDRAAEAEARVRSRLDRRDLAIDRATALLMLGEEAGWAASARPAGGASAREQFPVARWLYNTGSAAILWGHYRLAQERLSAALELAERNQFVRIRGRVLALQSTLDWSVGRWDGLAGRAHVLAADASLSPATRQIALRTLGRLRLAQGAAGEADRLARHALADGGHTGWADETLEPAALLGRLLLTQDRVDEALLVTDQPVRTVAAKGTWIWATDIAPVRLEALLAAGRLAGARQLVAELASGLRGRTAPAPQAALTTCRAIVLGRTGDAARAAVGYGRAARAWERLPRPYDALFCQERQAGYLFSAGRVEAAVALLADVFGRLSALDARGDADRVAHRLRQYGVEVRRPWRGGRPSYGDQLSPREREVVRLAVAGRTNREIAAALSRSRHTVATQIRSAMRKLNVSSRTALAISAVETGAIGGPPAPRTAGPPPGSGPEDGQSVKSRI